MTLSLLIVMDMNHFLLVISKLGFFFSNFFKNKKAGVVLINGIVREVYVFNSDACFFLLCF